MKKNRLFPLILMLLFSCIVYAQDYGASMECFMKEHETMEGSYIYKENSQLRSIFSSSIKLFHRDGKILYRYSEHGDGDYDKYSNITWDAEAEMEERNGMLRLIYSDRIVRGQAGEIIVKDEKRFDYEGQKICCTSLDGKGEVIKKKSFPIKGNTTDDITLSYFLKTFTAHRGDKAYRGFYLISSEPSLYRITIKFMKPEVLLIYA